MNTFYLLALLVYKDISSALNDMKNTSILYNKNQCKTAYKQCRLDFDVSYHVYFDIQNTPNEYSSLMCQNITFVYAIEIYEQV